jgi:hypothetical protein
MESDEAVRRTPDRSAADGPTSSRRFSFQARPAKRLDLSRALIECALALDGELIRGLGRRLVTDGAKHRIDDLLQLFHC